MTCTTTHLHHVDNVVGQPEDAEHHNYGQDEFLAADLPTELGLSEPSQDADVAGHYDSVGKQKSQYGLKGVLEPYLDRQ